VAEEPVNTNAVFARIVGTHVDFLVATFSGEPRRASTFEIVDEISTVCSQQTRTLGTVVWKPNFCVNKEIRIHKLFTKYFKFISDTANLGISLSWKLSLP